MPVTGLSLAVAVAIVLAATRIGRSAADSIAKDGSPARLAPP